MSRLRFSWRRLALYGAATLFFAVTTAVSWLRWAAYEYHTFDAAYYTQTLWELLHGHFSSSVLGVPLLGNHVEPIIVALAPLFAAFPHPLTLVAVQNAALACTAPLGYRIARSLGINPQLAVLLAIALFLTPATGYVALHEFHPEAFAAPLILLMVWAHLRREIRTYWAALLGLLACKENMALVVAAFCVVEFLRNRDVGRAERWRWYLGPLAVAIGWFAISSLVITPLLNRGKVDYFALYSRPLSALLQSVAHGNLLTALILPFLALPLLRPRWLLVAAPVLLQHLVSWRSSEWMIYFHYAAPVIPLMWMATAEVVASRRAALAAPLVLAVFVSCCAAQALLGPAKQIARDAANWRQSGSLRAEKAQVVAAIPAYASVMAPLSYLSHLALRTNLYSLHFILKGLNTLSRSAYTPPDPPDCVLIDYRDDLTFDPAAGFFHPRMQTNDGRVIASSETLLHDFLLRANWEADSKDSITLLRKNTRLRSPMLRATAAPIRICEGTDLITVEKNSTPGAVVISTLWRFEPQRRVFPWMYLMLVEEGTGSRHLINKGLCGIEAADGLHEERWLLTKASGAAPGNYTAELLFFDQSKRAWALAHSSSAEPAPLVPPIALGPLRIE